MLPKNIPLSTNYETDVITGERLLDTMNYINPGNYKKRDCFSRIQKYIYGNDYTRVCVLYGLRRTGKTTMMFQALNEMSPEDFSKAAYVKLCEGDTFGQINRDMYRLKDAGYKFIFIDEVTLLSEFIDSASLFSDIFVPMGMRIILSGGDSLGFWIAERNELYDRVRTIHTTFIPYKEFSGLLDINSVDEYIRYGGTLADVPDDSSFRDDESTRTYIDTAISQNIQNSLAFYKDGCRFRHLISLYDAQELTNAISRIVRDMNHRFVEKIITQDFDFDGLAAVDKEIIAERLMHIIEIENKSDQTVEITPAHISEIKEYLSALDLIQSCPIIYLLTEEREPEYAIFSQPGMRYCQAQALVHALMDDPVIRLLDSDKRKHIFNRILEQVRGRMLEDIVLLETSKELGRDYMVFKLEFARAEFDMVVHNRKTNTCSIFEIKHSGTIVKEQARHLLGEDECSLTERAFGRITGKFVIYLGDDSATDFGVNYLNAEKYLKSISEQIALCME